MSNRNGFIFPPFFKFLSFWFRFWNFHSSFSSTIVEYYTIHTITTFIFTIMGILAGALPLIIFNIMGILAGVLALIISFMFLFSGFILFYEFIFVYVCIQLSSLEKENT